MTEKDLDKNLDALLIDGLRKEAQQDEADFVNAMKHIGENDFLDILMPDRKFGRACAECAADNEEVDESPAIAACVAAEPLPQTNQDVAGAVKPRSFLMPWVYSVISAAAVIAIVLIPSFNSMNSKLCESTLAMSEVYIASSKDASGIDLSTASVEKIKENLPALERKYQECKLMDGSYTSDLREAGWDLTVAYLKLHKKEDAVKVLKVLSQQYGATPFGKHCQKMLKNLD